ncbi:Vinculin/alpha-catenin,PH domain-like,FERM/acyl-CoA-binding protein, 3-helical bundle,IRS-type PTB [Cinara cedri]|uniref:Vinculin/alpha-catenin,PH domain-like,FERM/acyl-CoA-binding protein, 3-helical bundle,IRS-type PTB n=1 Tax=Cinara cedri TaxID=506608 RepID=A0A5E4MSC5_9HEMI|nr:Vinculin/alpha-catenin,PH domain-like,FERM/acyl-CoA-binding protein, 3-helical bundle,IRS-type PTB [Cinara cedri]
MAMLSLRIRLVDDGVTKTMQFDPSISIAEACCQISGKTSSHHLLEYTLFLADEDSKKGIYLEPTRNFEYYILRNGDLLEYRKKIRPLKVSTLDGTLKTLMIDDTQPIANLMAVICAKLGITNHDEYSLVREFTEGDENNINVGNSIKKDHKMEHLRKKLKTDEDINWINSGASLREQGIDEREGVLLKRKFFFSDGNIDTHDPIQLNLLYVETRDAILKGTHPVTENLAIQLAGIQTHIQFGNHEETIHKSPLLDLKEFLPQSYIKIKGIEKKILNEHKKYIGLVEIEAKDLYTRTVRALPTYGVTFFLVKEEMKGKNKLVPRILGVTKDSVLRLDERSKEILQNWPLTSVRRWGASPHTFTLDFGDYSDRYYSVQTTEAEQILQLISGYIDIILKKKEAKDHFEIDCNEHSTVMEDTVSPLKAIVIESHGQKVKTQSVAKPTLLRIPQEPTSYTTGYISEQQYTSIEITCTEALSGVLEDLDLTMMENNNLEMEVNERKFSDYRESILKTSKTLVEDTKSLVAGVGVSKEQLDNSSKNAVLTVTKLVELVKSGAASLEDREVQIILINAVKDVASSLGELIRGCFDSPSMDELKDKAKVLVTNVTTLLKTVKSVDDERTKNTDLMKSTVEAIEKDFEENTFVTNCETTTEELVQSAKYINEATKSMLEIVYKGKPKDVTNAVQESRKSVGELLIACQGKNLNEKVLDAGRQVAEEFKTFLTTILENSKRPSTTTKRILEEVSQRLSTKVEYLITIVEHIETIEYHLLDSATSIDTAVKKLDTIQPRPYEFKVDESCWKSDEVILEAVKSIAAATCALVKTASLAQHEIGVDEGVDGLVYAARMVATATHSLVECAREIIEGFSSEDKLISAANQVASCTTQLLVACKVKSDPNSDATKRLLASGNVVKRATENVVRAARQAMKTDEVKNFILNERVVGGMAQEIDARSDVLRIERELDEARKRLIVIRQSKNRSVDSY